MRGAEAASRSVPLGLTGTKSTRRKDASPDDDSDEFDLLDSDGRTSRKYLQRHIGEGGARFLWRDEGTYAVPRIKLPGHPGGTASRESISETERDFEKRNRDWQDNCFLEHAEQTAKRVLTRDEYRVFAARFLNKKKPTHQQLGDKLGFTESGIRRIKDRAFEQGLGRAAASNRANSGGDGEVLFRHAQQRS